MANSTFSFNILNWLYRFPLSQLNVGGTNGKCGFSDMIMIHKNYSSTMFIIYKMSLSNVNVLNKLLHTPYTVMIHNTYPSTRVIIGGSRGGVPGARPPYGTQFFRFRIHFHQKVPTSEVHAPPTANPGSATGYDS